MHRVPREKERKRENDCTPEFRRNINRDNHSWNLCEAPFYPRFVHINYTCKDVERRIFRYIYVYTKELLAASKVIFYADDVIDYSSRA